MASTIQEPTYSSKRIENYPGYIEHIYCKQGGENRRIATITDSKEGFICYYGIMQYVGSSISTVKEALFDAINEGL